jgi:hypothetical protein
MKDEHRVPPREPWGRRPESSLRLLELSDDELLFWIEALPTEHKADRDLIEIVRSRRHFFIRQEAAKRILDASLLKDHAGDRHIGQILVRGMRRAEDASYLQRLIAETRHLEVRKAAEAQLRIIQAALAERGSGS